MNSYYNHSIFPAPNAPGSSSAMRSELESITQAFDLLPTLAGNGYKLAMINSSGTALVPTALLQSLGIISSTIDSTVIGATTPSAGTFTNLSVTGNALLGSAVDINGGAIDATLIGAATPASGSFTTLAASSGYTGNVTGNVAGNVTGNVTGNLTGNVTGNVTANTGSSTFNNVVINGQLDMDAGSASTIVNLSTPTNSGDAANKGYVDTQDALKLSLAGGAMSGAIAMGANKITGLGDPVSDQDAATKVYVDTAVQGLDAKASARVATTANITLSGTQTIDDIAVTAGDRVLVKSQTASAENGVYVAAAGAWSRAPDANAWAELVAAFTFVEAGTTNGNNGYVCTVTAGGTLGTTAVTWVQFSGAGQITAGAGMTKTGNQLDVGTASSARIVVNADSIDLATTGVGAGTYKSVTTDVYGRITGGTNPTTISGFGITDAYTKTEVDSANALKLSLAGGTMSGAIAMGANKITGMADPTLAQDAATKAYTDSILGSATSAAASASAAASSAASAANSATSAASSATAAATSASDAAASYDAFDDRYLGSKVSDPTLDNDGNALLVGALYWNSGAKIMKVYDGAAWVASYLPAAGYLPISGGTMTGDIAFAGTQTFDPAKLASTVSVSKGGTGATTAGGALTNLGAQAALVSGTNIKTVNGTSLLGSGNVSVGAVTSVTGTSPVASSGGAAPAISLASGYGDTQNPFAAKTANYVLAAPNGIAGAPTFRAIVAADIPTLNQNTTGTASNVTGTVAVANGGTGATTLTANNVLLGNGTSALQKVAPGSSGNVLTSNGTTWTSAAPAATLEGKTLSYVTALGSGAGYSASGSSGGNAFLGYWAGYSSYFGSYNTAVGSNALQANANNSNNTAVGYYSLKSATANDNTGVGYKSLTATTTGTRNTSVGSNTLISATASNDNTAVGYNALSAATGSQNVVIGSYAMDGAYTGSNNIVIGYGAYPSGDVSNEVTLGNSSITSNRFWGDLKPGGSNAGTSGQVLTSAGSGVSPAWADLPAAGADVQTFTASGTWTKPSGKTLAIIELLGAGGGGGGGNMAGNASPPDYGQGGLGGGGGAYLRLIVPISTLPSSRTVTIGAAGTSGAGGVSYGDGSAGGAGGSTSFGTYVAYGGAGGAGGASSSSGNLTSTAGGSFVATGFATAAGQDATGGVGAPNPSVILAPVPKGASTYLSGAGGGAGGNVMTGSGFTAGSAGGQSVNFGVSGGNGGAASDSTGGATGTNGGIGCGGGGGGAGTYAAGGAGGIGGAGYARITCI